MARRRRFRITKRTATIGMIIFGLFIGIILISQPFSASNLVSRGDFGTLISSSYVTYPVSFDVPVTSSVSWTYNAYNDLPQAEVNICDEVVIDYCNYADAKQSSEKAMQYVLIHGFAQESIDLKGTWIKAASQFRLTSTQKFPLEILPHIEHDAELCEGDFKEIWTIKPECEAVFNTFSEDNTWDLTDFPVSCHSGFYNFDGYLCLNYESIQVPKYNPEFEELVNDDTYYLYYGKSYVSNCEKNGQIVPRAVFFNQNIQMADKYCKCILGDLDAKVDVQGYLFEPGDTKIILKTSTNVYDIQPMWCGGKLLL